MVHGDGKFWGKVDISNSGVSDDKNWGKHNTKIHRHTKNHNIHYTSRHTHSHGRKPTLLTIIQLLPGTTVINHIVLLINYFLSPGPYTHSQQEFGISLSSHWNQQELCWFFSPNFLIRKVFLPKWMILEYIPHSLSKSATCKYRREDRMRIRSHRCTVFCSFGTVENLWWASGGVLGTQQGQSTHTQDERQHLCLEDGTSKSFWVGKCRILFLEGMLLLQERQLYKVNGC